ncbi:hypothetical protein D3C87_1586440 [compost metagenome]
MISNIVRPIASGTRSGSLLVQNSGYPVSFCGQSPCTTKPYRLSLPHCWRLPEPSELAQNAGDQESEST